MSNTYVIQWKSKINGRAGRGTKSFSREEAERLAAELNQEYPQILHEAVDAEHLPQPREEQGAPAEAERAHSQVAADEDEETEEEPSDSSHAFSVE